MVPIEKVLKDLELRELKLLGTAMVDKLEGVKEYVNDNIDDDILNYLIIGSADDPFKVNMEALLEVDNQQHALAMAGIAGGMCEMSDTIVKISKEVTRREK